MDRAAIARRVGDDERGAVTAEPVSQPLDTAATARRVGDDQRGAVTAELAVVLPAVTLVLAAVLSVGQAVVAQLACVDAARAGARAAARGDDLAAVRQTAVRASASTGSDGLAVDVAAVPDQVEVTVSRSLRLLAIAPVVHVSARAVAQREQTGVDLS